MIYMIIVKDAFIIYY